MKDDVAHEQLYQMGPNILLELTKIIDPAVSQYIQGDIDQTILFEEISGCNPCLYRNDGSIKGPFGDCHEVVSGQMPELSQNIDIEPWMTSATSPRLVKWWNSRMAFPKTSILLQRLRSVTGNSESQFRQYGACQSALLSRDVLVYGVFALPAIIEVIATDDNVCVFSEFLYQYEYTLFYELCRKPYSDKTCLEHLRETYPKASDKLRFIRNWWYSVCDTYTSLPELHDEIERKVAALCPTDTADNVPGYLDSVPRPDVKVPSLNRAPNISAIRREMSLSALETALSCRTVRVDHSLAPDVIGPKDRSSVAIWRWSGTNGLSNYLVVWLFGDGTVCRFSVRHGWLDPGLPKYLEES